MVGEFHQLISLQGAEEGKESSREGEKVEGEGAR